MSLVSVCSIAFVSVFILLGFLAAAMQLITVLFAARQPVTDPAIAAVISSTVATLIPGAQVTHIEEER
jgi:hypothetical protein